MKRIFSCLVLVCVGSFSGLASAQVEQRSAPRRAATESAAVQATSDDSGVKYEFGDELLDATLNDGSIPRITVHPVRTFGQLIRPRTHFVPELLKSVERI